MHRIALIVVYLACVQAKPSLTSGRIFGGKDVPIEERPYQVSMEFFGMHYCGGSIISPHYVVTAGRCLGNIYPSLYKIRVGTDLKNESGVLHEVEYVKRHEKYFMNDWRIPNNDIGIVRVKSPFKFNEKVQPIKIAPLGEKVKAGVISMTSGWGSTEFKHSTTHLRAVSMPAYNQTFCNQIYPEVEKIVPGGVSKSSICAGIYGFSYMSICSTDYGGPMTIDGYLAGVASWVLECGSPIYPSVFTDVAYFHDWILENTKD